MNFDDLRDLKDATSILDEIAKGLRFRITTEAGVGGNERHTVDIYDYRRLEAVVCYEIDHPAFWYALHQLCDEYELRTKLDRENAVVDAG